MKIVSFSTRLTPTAIGQSNTNDSYIYFPKEDYITNQFFSNTSNHMMTFTDKRHQTTRTFSMTFGRENRLNQFGPFARGLELQSGDEVILQRIIYDDGTEEYFFDYTKHEDIVVLQYLGPEKQFISWNPERFEQFFSQLPQPIQILTDEGQRTVTIEDNGSFKKRVDSPNEYQSYKLNGIQHILDMNEFKSKHKLILTKVADGSYYIANRPINWEFSVFEAEGRA